MAIKSVIPEVDISPFLNKDSSPADRSSIIRQVEYALESIGFLTIVGHNVPHTVITSMLEAAKEFMYLPSEAKLLLPLRNGTRLVRTDTAGIGRVLFSARKDLM